MNFDSLCITVYPSGKLIAILGGERPHALLPQKRLEEDARNILELIDGLPEKTKMCLKTLIEREKLEKSSSDNIHDA